MRRSCMRVLYASEMLRVGSGQLGDWIDRGNLGYALRLSIISASGRFVFCIKLLIQSSTSAHARTSRYFYRAACNADAV